MVSRVPPGIELPEPLRLLFEWVDDNGFVHLDRDGRAYGTLSEHWPIGPGTYLLLHGLEADEVGGMIDAWFGPTRDGLPVVWPFCQTDGDGSMAALWLDPEGRTRVVHMGSGSGSLLTCELAKDAVDFLRLIAIGYPELCWHDGWTAPPEPGPDHGVHNEPFRRWVRETFGVQIPATASEIVPAPAEMGDKDTTDEWCQWDSAALRERYAAELTELGVLAHRCVDLAGDDVEFIYGLQTLAAFTGRGVWSRHLSAIADGEVLVGCVECGEHLLIEIEDVPAKVTLWEGAGTPTTVVATQDPTPDEVRLLALAESNDRPLVTDKLRELFGQATCPACGATFRIERALL